MKNDDRKNYPVAYWFTIFLLGGVMFLVIASGIGGCLTNLGILN